MKNLLERILMFVSYSSTMTLALDITQFHVPRYVNLRDEVKLRCDFRLKEFERLHSVKWYRNVKGIMEEFYSYQPDRNPPAKFYKRNGIKIDMRHSSMKMVIMKRVSLDSTGNFRCEVTSRNSPGYNSKIEQGRMEVLALPESDPIISGGLKHYQIGDHLELNCTSTKTFPPTKLKWFVNGHEVDSSMLTPYPTKKGVKSGLYKSRVGLNLTVKRSLFHYGKIRLECIGNIDDGSIIQGWSQGSSQHLIERIRLPEALKRERTQVFVVPLTSSAKILKVEWNLAVLLVMTVILINIV